MGNFGSISFGKKKSKFTENNCTHSSVIGDCNFGTHTHWEFTFPFSLPLCHFDFCLTFLTSHSHFTTWPLSHRRQTERPNSWQTSQFVVLALKTLTCLVGSRPLKCGNNLNSLKSKRLMEKLRDVDPQSVVQYVRWVRNLFRHFQIESAIKWRRKVGRNPFRSLC